jgi:hypothetical protein
MICLINRERLLSLEYVGGKSFKGIRIGDAAFVPYSQYYDTYILVTVIDIDTYYGIIYCYDSNTGNVDPYTYEYILMHNEYFSKRNK